MVAHFDTSATRPAHAWVLGTNANACDEVTVLWAHPVPETFDARRSAHARRYVYRILDRRNRDEAVAVEQPR
jgi:tRNA pseudouridine38-40 synthase